MAIWQALPRSLDLRRANNFTEGIDTEKSPFFVSENSLVSGYGWDFNDYPALKVRDGRTAHGASGGAITRLLANFGNTHLVRAVGTQLQYNSSGTTWTNISGSYANVDWDFANFDVNGPALIILNPTNGGYYWNGSSLTAISDMPKGKYVTADNLRVFVAGVAAEQDAVYYSAFQNALDWTTAENSGIVQYYTANGGPITAIKAFNGSIWVFKRDAFAIIYHTGSADITYRLVPVSDYIGCVAYKTVIEVGPYLLWLGRDNVYIGAGDAAKPIGDPIKAYINNINWSAVDNAFAFGTDKRYYLCIPTGSNTQPDICLVYDYIFRKWLPYSITLGGLRWGAKLDGVPYAGDASGQTFRMNNGTTDAGAAIPWRVQSRPYDDGVKEAEKELHHMYIQGYFPAGTSVSVDVAPDDIGSTWVNISYDPTSGAAFTQNKRLIVPLDTVPLCNFYAYRISGSGPATIQ
ncbi:hypothetical protein, partial [Paenibacillus cisolokensis]|uniref:hypothetical protein n=1 Tax=Paenibacillus cisolokensis TaxID=1658519 RepID=UPI001BCEA735